MRKNNVLPSFKESESGEVPKRAQAIQTGIATPPAKARGGVLKKNVRGWPPARRQAQAARIRLQMPWLKTTGPKTPEGKARCRMNARKHGVYGAEWKNIRAGLRAHRTYLHYIKRLILEESRESVRQITPRLFSRNGTPIHLISGHSDFPP